MGFCTFSATIMSGTTAGCRASSVAFAAAAACAKAVITGDVTQIDLPQGRTSGLVEAMKVVSAIDGISFIHFDDRDVVRHKLVQQIVKAYEKFSNGNGRHPA